MLGGEHGRRSDAPVPAPSDNKQVAPTPLTRLWETPAQEIAVSGSVPDCLDEWSFARREDAPASQLWNVIRNAPNDGGGLEGDVLGAVTAHYLKSRDFNGMSLGECSAATGLEIKEITDQLRELISAGLIGMLSPTDDINVHILRLGFPPIAHQMERLGETDRHHTCLYPTEEHLGGVVRPDEAADRPYERELMLGAPQLSFRAFDLSVLEIYRNDPRYSYWTNDLSGRLSISDAHYESEEMKDRDKVLLSSFGYAYSESGDRAAAVYLRYLADLSPEHQQIWRARELGGGYKLHPEFYRMSILGEWPERVPIIDALL